MSNISGLTEAYASIYGQTSPQILNEEIVNQIEESATDAIIRELEDSEWEKLGALYDSLVESGNFSHEEALNICEKKKTEMEKGEKEEEDEKAGEDQEHKYKKSGKKSKDYDDDGTVEDESHEYAGVKDRAIKKAVKKEKVEEEAKNAYAIGTAAAMKQEHDTPPLKKSTINKAHKIAKKIIQKASYEPEGELVDENRAMARDPEGRKSGHSKQPDPSKPGFTGVGNMSIKQIMALNKKIESKSVNSSYEAEGEEMLDEKTAMAKRGYDETKIRNKIAKSTGGGEAADRATALENKPTFGDTNKTQQRQRLARAQRGNFRKTTSSSPGLHGYGHKATNDDDRAKQAARGRQRSALTPKEKKQLNMSYDATEYSSHELEIINEVLPALAAAAGRALASGAVRSAVGNVAKNAAKEKVKQVGVNVVRNALGGNNSEDA